MGGAKRTAVSAAHGPSVAVETLVGVSRLGATPA